MRPIDGDALIEQMKRRKDFVGRPSDPVCLVEDAPTIEAEPVRHAHWNGWTATHWTKKYDNNGDPIYTEHTYYQCSKCRRRTVIRSAYCPACGSKMDEVSE